MLAKKLLLIICATSLSNISYGSPYADSPLSCQDTFEDCDDSGIRHLPLNETWHFSLDGSWTLALLNSSATENAPENGATFAGYLSLTRIRKCEIKLAFQNVTFDTGENNYSESVISRYDKGSAKQVCRKILTNEQKLSETSNHLVGLTYGVISALTNTAFNENILRDKKISVNEVDNFGDCQTNYTIDSSSSTNFMVKKSRDLSQCGNIQQKFADENGKILFYQKNLGNYVEKSEWRCDQNYIDGLLRGVKCSHDVTMTETAKFSSILAMSFLSSELSDNIGSEDYEHDYIIESQPETESQTELYKQTEEYLIIICENSKVGLTNDALLALPKVLSIFNILDSANIKKLFRIAKSGNICKGNQYFRSLFDSVLRDSYSPAAASAKCKIMLEDNTPPNVNWASSLGYTLLPTDATLAQCSELLRLPSWTDSVIGVTSLAQNYKSNHCHVRARDFDACKLSKNFQSLTRALWLKARNCLNTGEEYQNMALSAIQGLSNLDSVGSDVTTSLISCVNSPVSTTEVKIASLRALSKKICVDKTPLWIQSLIFKSELGSEIRIEAFKTLLRCNEKTAKELIKMASSGNVDFKSSQVTSFIESYNTVQNVTNLLKLSRHFDINLDDTFGFQSDSKLDGDIIFDDSFIPQSLRLSFYSNMLKDFGGYGEVEIRQKNLEDVLQPLFGPEGIKGSLHSLLQEVILTFFETFRNPNNSNSQNERHKRSLNVQDIKTTMAEVKEKLKSKFEASILVKLGENLRFFSSSFIDPILGDIERTLQDYLDSLANNIYYSIANYETIRGYSWILRSDDSIAWSFFGPSLRLRQHEGLVGTMELSSQLSFFSSISSLFSPSINIILNPSFGGYWHSSMSFDGVNDVSEAKLESPLHGGFDFQIEIKPMVEEHVELIVDLAQESFHGYSASILKELVIKNKLQHLSSPPPHKTQKLIEKGVANVFLPKHFMNIEIEHSNCNQELMEGLGLKPCQEFTVWKGERGSVHHSRFSLSNEHNDRYNLFISTKNSGQNSYFLSTKIETEGLAAKKEGSIVFGFNVSPHTTLKILAQAGTHVAAFEGSIVNDWNLKRLEMRSTFGKDEYGMKAEILIGRDGGQTSIKPRLVISSPQSKEDALLDGYLAHYTSDKVKSFTVDLLTEGSLKKVYDLALKGTTEYRSYPNGDWSLSMKNLHLRSPGLELGLESSINIKEFGADISNQVTWDGELFVMGAILHLNGISENAKQYDLSLHFLSPSRSQWDTKIDLITSFFDGQISNNLTLLNGPEDNRWKFVAHHLTTWKFLFNNIPNDYKMKDTSNGLLQNGRTTKIFNMLDINIPTEKWNWKLQHNFQASDTAIENHVTLHHLNNIYSIMANFFDQSEKLFKYHMEIEVEFPEWKFGYVDTLLQRAEGDIVGQSVAVMPSGRVYTSSSRLKYENVLDYLILELTYDTLVRDGATEFRISFRHTLENSLEHLNVLLSLDAPEPLLAVEFTLEGLGTHHKDMMLKAFMTRMFEVELSSRSSKVQTEISLSLDLMSLSKLIKSTVAVGSKFPGGGNLDGEVIMSSPQNPSVAPISIAVASSLEMEQPGIYLVKSDVSLMGWGWSAELKTELGQRASDPQTFTILVILPDKSRFEGKSYLLIDYGKEEQKFGVETEIKLPSNIIYKLSLGGESVFDENSLAEANLLIEINSPFTNNLFLKTFFKNHHEETMRNFTFFCNTISEANYWKELYIDFNWNLDADNWKTMFEGKFGDKRVNLESLGSYKTEEDSHKIKMTTEFKLPTGGEVEQFKISLDGLLYSTSNPPVLKVNQLTYVQKNFAEIFRSSGSLEMNIPEVKGSFTAIHAGNRFTNQEYKLEGSFTGEELEISIQGMVDRTPVRTFIHYIDGETLKVAASYGGSSFANIDFTSHLQGFSFRLKEAISPNLTLTTIGNIIFRKRKTRFQHTLRLSKTHSSSNLRINSLRGKPVKISSSRTKLNLNEWKTEGKIEWGSIKMNYNDEITFKSLKDFDVKAFFHCPAYELRDLNFHIIASHDDVTDQTLFMKYTRDDAVINSGRFSITTASLQSPEPFEINAELVDIVLQNEEYDDFKFRQFLALPENGLKMESILKRGGIPLTEIGLSVSEDSRGMLFSVCSTDTKCIRLNGEVNSFNQESPIKNFAIEVKFLNSLFWTKYFDKIIQHSLALVAENKLNTGDDVRLSAKLSRHRCEEIHCEMSEIIGKHHALLKASRKSIDVVYETINRTMLLKTSLLNGITKTLADDDSKLLKIQVWFDRINKPNDVFIWTTSYQILESKKKIEEVVSSVLQHPYIERPVSVNGTLSTLGSFKREALIVFDVFEEPHHALQLHILKDYRAGGYKLQVDLKNIEERLPHFSLSTVLVPSPDAGLFNLRIDTPLLVSSNASESISFKYKCKMEVEQEKTKMLCTMNSATVTEDFNFEYGIAPDPCSGLSGSSEVFNDTYKIYGIYCHQPLNIDLGLAITDDQDENLRAKVGFEGPNNFQVDFLEAAKADVTLLPPFLLQGVFYSSGTPLQKLQEFKTILRDEWNSLVRRSKNLASRILHDSEKFGEVFKTTTWKPSQIEEFSKILSINSKDVIDELTHDELFVDISSAIETSANISSVLFNLGLTYIENVTGNNFDFRPLSLYVSNTYNLTLNLMSKFYKGLKEESNWVFDFVKGVAFEISSWLHQTYEYFINETTLREPLKWFIHKINTITIQYSWAQFRSAITNSINAVRKILSLFYSNINYDTSEKFTLIIPLTKNIYDFDNLFSFQRNIKRYSSVSLRQEILKWVQRFLNPTEFMEYTMPPFDAQGVVIGSSVITFDGKSLLLDVSCPHLLLVLKGINKTKSVALASGMGNRKDRNKEYVLIFGQDVIHVHEDRSILFNNSTISLPYHEKSVLISRDLNNIDITLISDNEALLSFSCKVDRDVCVVNVNGWLFADTYGLLGNFNYDTDNEFVLPDGSVISSSEIWEESWSVDKNCTKTNLEFSSIETQPDESFVNFCKRMLLDNDSPAVPCHNTVNVQPYYVACLNSLQTLQYFSSRIKKSPKLDEEIINSLLHIKNNTIEGYNEIDSNDNEHIVSKYVYVNTQPNVHKSHTIYNKRQVRSLSKAFSASQAEEPKIKASLPQASEGEMEVMCDVISAYSKTCLKNKNYFDLPVECDIIRRNIHMDQITPNVFSIDLLILFEETECSSFIYDNIVYSIQEDLNELLNSSDIDISIGLIGYGSSDISSITVYGKGNTLLIPLQEYVPPILRSTKLAQGTLLRAFDAVKNYPFRGGTIRVVFVASCSNQDMAQVTSSFNKELAEKRIIIFALTPGQLFRDPLRPRVNRNIVGMSSKNSYHLKKGIVQQGNTSRLAIPQSNLCHLSLQTGGSVFTVASLKNEKKASFYMKIFRQILVKSFIQAANDLYTKLIEHF